ncbi:unnamed protein product [Ambrosiozyma monospora]|uniref:Origin recognition complex subunit 1 n=1 Tax=Ambrosiozyma monospora TaxID=43982 RepID=A0A9W6WF07_AMBMO|nr:unnamed protein product [Ambrosiozyma monospora]
MPLKTKPLNIQLNGQQGTRSKRQKKKAFDFLEINGLKLVVPQAAYENLWLKISPNSAKANSVSLLESYFSDDGNKYKKTPLVVLLDELDQIVTRSQSVMYNFFNWPSYTNSKLIVIAVANTMDLPERMLTNKISSRLGLTRIQFPGYTYNQLSEIIQNRLESLEKLNEGKLVITKDAIEFASRKVASVSGDARRSLIICVRAVEIAEAEFEKLSKQKKKSLNGKYSVGIKHIASAISETTSTPIAKYLNTLTFAAKMLLAAILLRKRRTGLAEIVLGDVIDELNNQFNISHFKHFKKALTEEQLQMFDVIYDDVSHKVRLRMSGLAYILRDLEDNGILIQQQLQAERPRLIRLNVSEDEILNCFKKDELLKDIVINT